MAQIVTKSDDLLLQALLSGAHPSDAAQIAQVSVRTVYRRLSDPEFMIRFNEARAAINAQVFARLAFATGEAIDTLRELLQISEDENTRLKAAQTLLASMKSFGDILPRHTKEVKTSISV